jgi:serine/threonine protein kinase
LQILTTIAAPPITTTFIADPRHDRNTPRHHNIHSTPATPAVAAATHHHHYRPELPPPPPPPIKTANMWGGTTTASHRYTPSVDMWSVGCILAEVLTVSGNPENGEDFRTLFPGGDEMRQIEMISTVLGKPSQAYIAGISNPVCEHGRPLYLCPVCSVVVSIFFALLFTWFTLFELIPSCGILNTLGPYKHAEHALFLAPWKHVQHALTAGVLETREARPTAGGPWKHAEHVLTAVDVCVCGERPVYLPSIDCERTLQAIRAYIESRIPDTAVRVPFGELGYFKGMDPVAIDLLEKLLVYEHESRLTAEEVLAHPFFEKFHDVGDEPSAEIPFDASFEDLESTVENWAVACKAEIASFQAMGKGLKPYQYQNLHGEWIPFSALQNARIGAELEQVEHELQRREEQAVAEGR